MSDKAWAERRPGYHVYYDVNVPTTVYGDIYAIIVDPLQPCKYDARVRNPPPRGRPLGTFDDLDTAKQAVEQAVAEQLI